MRTETSSKGVPGSLTNRGTETRTLSHTHTHKRNRPSVRPVLVPVAATTTIKWYILLDQRNPVSSVSASVRETHQTLQTFRWPNGRPSSTNMKTRTRPSIITISVKLNQTRASNFAPYSGQLYCTCTCVFATST